MRNVINSRLVESHDLAIWTEGVTGGKIVAFDRLPGGNRRQAWGVDVRFPDGGTRELFLRVDPDPDQESGDSFTLRREAQIYRSLTGSGIRIPQLVALHDLQDAMLVERVPGRSAFHQISDSPEGVSVARDLIECLGKLHSVEPVDIGFPGIDPRRPITDHIGSHAELWETMYRSSGGVDDPLIECALRWLASEIPDVQEPPRIVHGDFGPGNFLFQDGRVTALADWELAHLGDPIEDLAWLSMRSVFEPLPDFSALVGHYEEHTGTFVEPSRLLYHRVWVQARVAIIRHRALGDANPSGDVANGLLSQAVNRRLLVECLSSAACQQLPEPAPMLVPSDSEHTWLYESALTAMREIVVPDCSDPLAVARAKGVARVLKLLREVDRMNRIVEGRELRSLGELLGLQAESVREGRRELARRIRLNEFTLSELLPHFALTVSDQTSLMRDALGALAVRSLPVAK